MSVRRPPRPPRTSCRRCGSTCSKGHLSGRCPIYGTSGRLPPGCRRCGSTRSKGHSSGRCPIYATTTTHSCQRCDRGFFHKKEDCKTEAGTNFIANSRAGYLRLAWWSWPADRPLPGMARNERYWLRQDKQAAQAELEKRRKEGNAMLHLYPRLYIPEPNQWKYKGRKWTKVMEQYNRHKKWQESLENTKRMTILRVHWRSRGWQGRVKLTGKTVAEREQYMSDIRDAYKPLMVNQEDNSDEEYLRAAEEWNLDNLTLIGLAENTVYTPPRWFLTPDFLTQVDCCVLCSG